MRETRSVEGTMDGVADARAAFDAFSRRAGLADTARWRFHVALDEILSNVVRHGFGPGRASALAGDAAIELVFGVEDGVILIEVTDPATPFNPLEAPPPDTTSAIESRVPGGLGIALVTSLMDDVQYERRADRNHVIMKWRVRDVASAGTDR